MLRGEFNYPKDLLYFNAAHQVFAPTRVLDAVVRELRWYEGNPSQAFLETPLRLVPIQEKLAHFFGAEAQDIFLRPNITSVLNPFIQGFQLQGRSEILVSDFEYSSIQTAVRVRAERDGISLRRIALPSSPAALASLTASTLLEKLTSQLSDRTGMVVLSHITGGIGLRLPIEALAETTRANGILLVVDGAHASGTQKIDFQALQNVDAYAISLQKAMFGPKGTALGWVAPRAQRLLCPTEGALGTYASESFADRFRLTGSFDYAPFLALKTTLELWEQFGETTILDETRRLRNELAHQLMEVPGMQPCFSADSTLQSSILTFRLGEKFRSRIGMLASEVLQVSKLQLSAFLVQDAPHVQLSALAYNSDAELEKAKDALASFLSKGSRASF